MMYMRIVRAQPAEGQADELARRWAAFWPEKLRAQSGFQHAHFGIDRATGGISGVRSLRTSRTTPCLSGFRPSSGPPSGRAVPASRRSPRSTRLPPRSETGRGIDPGRGHHRGGVPAIIQREPEPQP